jgi:hypothetical protein
VFQRKGVEIEKDLKIDLDGYAKDVANEKVRARLWGIYTLHDSKAEVEIV